MRRCFITLSFSDALRYADAADTRHAASVYARALMRAERARGARYAASFAMPLFDVFSFAATVFFRRDVLSARHAIYLPALIYAAAPACTATRFRFFFATFDDFLRDAALFSPPVSIYAAMFRHDIFFIDIALRHASAAFFVAMLECRRCRLYDFRAMPLPPADCLMPISSYDTYARPLLRASLRVIYFFRYAAAVMPLH